MIRKRRIDISRSQALNMIKNDNRILVIDVKSQKEYDNFHLDNSINIPIERFKYMAQKLLNNKNKKIIVYCSTGVRSIAACEILCDMGFKNVYNVVTGIV